MPLGSKGSKGLWVQRAKGLTYGQKGNLMVDLGYIFTKSLESWEMFKSKGLASFT